MSGLYCGLLNVSLTSKCIGIFNPDFSGRNLPSSILVARSYDIIFSFWRSDTFFSMLPNPAVDILPTTATFPISARSAVTLVVAAHPPFSSKSVRRNSLTQISAHLGCPSSDKLIGLRFGLRIPIMIVLTSLRFGIPTMVILFGPSYL
ncbi:hypothetical protein DSECCO2_566800 [anaerobic digester metagenome]